MTVMFDLKVKKDPLLQIKKDPLWQNVYFANDGIVLYGVRLQSSKQRAAEASDHQIKQLLRGEIPAISRDGKTIYRDTYSWHMQIPVEQ